MWSFCYFEKGQVRNDHKEESSMRAVRQDVNHTADAVDTGSYSHRPGSLQLWKVGFLFSDSGEFTDWLGVSAVWDFWAAMNSWALTGHSGICFIWGERDGSRQATHLCREVPFYTEILLKLSHICSLCFVFDTNLPLRKNDTGIKGPEQKVNVCWLPRTKEVKKGHILQVPAQWSSDPQNKQVSKDIFEASISGHQNCWPFLLERPPFFPHLLNPPDTCHRTSNPSLDGGKIKTRWWRSTSRVAWYRRMKGCLVAPS